MMAQEVEQVLLSVWRQVVDGAKSVEIDGKNYPVKLTAKRGLKQVDFEFDGHELRGLEQNPETKSKWAALAREAKKVMQFLDAGRVRGGWEDEDLRVNGMGIYGTNYLQPITHKC